MLFLYYSGCSHFNIAQPIAGGGLGSHAAQYETFEKRSISFKIKAREDFNHRNILSILRIEIRTKRRDWVKGGVLQRSQYTVMRLGIYFQAVGCQIVLRTKIGICPIL